MPGNMRFKKNQSSIFMHVNEAIDENNKVLADVVD
jgi:hypothetical protein